MRDRGRERERGGEEGRERWKGGKERGREREEREERAVNNFTIFTENP